MRNFLVCIILFLTTYHASFGQAYKYIGVTEGLSDHRVLSIQKDNRGFMWFLTYRGIDRYDGNHFKHYSLQSEEGYISLFSEKTILKTDSKGNVWAISEQGQLFVYNPQTDLFVHKQLPPEITTQKIERIEMTDFDEIWYCYPEHCYTYDLNTAQIQQIQTDHKHKHITSIFQYDENIYYIGSEDGICRVIIHEGKMVATECIIPSKICELAQRIYVHPNSNRLMAYSDKNGMIVYDITLRKLEKQHIWFKDFPITGFNPFEEKYILIPTRGAGVYRYNLQEQTLEQYLHAQHDKPNKMNGNNIRALFVDECNRLWMSVYARSVTIFDKALPQYTWYKKNIGNPNSLNDELVNAILEDRDGDIWFATNNGLNLYSPSTNTWKHLFEWNPTNPETLKNCIFLSLHETDEGHIIAGGFMTGVYSINKKTLEATLLTPHSYKQNSNPNFANNYIRVIYQDSEGLTWTGGNYYLGCVDAKNQTFKNYFIGSVITCLLEKDSTTLLIGTGDGMYSMNKKTKEINKMRMPFASGHINTMYMHPNGDLYIGTTNSGLVILHQNGEHHIYRMQNSALLSNTINDIIPKNENDIVIVTEQNLAMFYVKQQKFLNWTEDMGLIKTYFNPRAGIHTSRGTFIVGSGNGAIEWNDTMKLPQQEETPIIIDKIKTSNPYSTSEDTISYSSVDSLNTIRLPYEEKSLAIYLTTIDYYTPSYTYFKWQLKGKYDYWTKTARNSWLEFRNLKPGEYTLSIQNIARDDYRILNKKELRIIIEPSFWHTKWAKLIILLLIITLVFICWKIFQFGSLWNRTKKKLSIFTRNTQSLQTPLALIKAAVNDIATYETLSPKGQTLLNMVNYNTDSIHKMAINLISLEQQTSIRSRKLDVSRQQLDKLIGLYTELFTPLASQQGITLAYYPTAQNTKVWVNTQKMELIFYNLFDNIIRYTQTDGKITIRCHADERRWNVIISNETERHNPVMLGSEEIHHMDKEEFGGELSLILQLVKRHYGNLQYEKSSPAGYTFEASFPIEHPEYIKKGKGKDLNPIIFFKELWTALQLPQYHTEIHVEKQGHILLVEESDGSLAYMDSKLNEDWNISMAHNIETAVEIVNELPPDVIITSFIAPDNRGEDLCSILKSNPDTNHIPIIMLMMDDEKEELEKMFKLRADYYITNTFDMQGILNILKNIQDSQQSRKKRLEQTALEQDLQEIKNTSIKQEANFLNELKKLIKQHIDNPDFNVDDLCNFVGMSRTSLYNKMKTLTTQSPSDLIREARMTRAAEMLLANEYTIMEVSERMGFSEPKYFREVFKKHFGMTPSEYIKKQVG